jgi:CRISPR/Cas system endoribonuclease Cas6 (RAMP superfamily)
MEILYDLLKITIPSVIVAYLAYLLVRSFLQNKLEEVLLAMRQKNQEVALPIRLQAYERICLLLERTAPANLAQRLSNAEYTAGEFQQIMIHEIRQEYNHNLSQQVYVSNDAWMYISSAIEQVISDINAAARGLDEKANSIDLVKLVLEAESEKEVNVLQQALTFVKEEARNLF